MKRFLLILLLLSPWLVALWVGLHNLRQQPRPLQLLTRTTPSLPIGGWLLVSSSLGVTLGATAVGVLLQTERSPRRRWPQASLGEENVHGNGTEGEESDPRRWQDPESSLGELPPIMDVPFRVVRPTPTSGPTPDAAPSSPYNDDDWQPPQSEDW